MTVVRVTPDEGDRGLTIVVDLAVRPDRAWRLWADPRTLERWWGPPTWPATVTEHELAPGGRVAYRMTGPDGTHAHGWWRIRAVDAPSLVEFEDGFSDSDGVPDPVMPVTVVTVELAPHPGGTRMTIVSRYASVEQMRQLLDMGMAEGMAAALGQVDAILAEA